jgi:hypothetical protein
LVSSWAYSFLVRIMNLPYFGWRTRSVTVTTAVLSILLDTTSPHGSCGVALGRRLGFDGFTSPWSRLASAISRARMLGVDTGDLTLHLADFGGVVELTGGVAETQVEEPVLLGRASPRRARSVDPFRSVQCVRTPSEASSRVMMRALIGSFWIALVHGGRAVSSSGYDSSNSTRPGLTTATQNSGLPLPEPMRVSAGFCVTGLSGKMLIHTLPPRLMCTGHGDTSGLDLAGGDPARLERLDAVLAVGDSSVPPLDKPVSATAVVLAVLDLRAST